MGFGVKAGIFTFGFVFLGSGWILELTRSRGEVFARSEYYEIGKMEALWDSVSNFSFFKNYNVILFLIIMLF